MKTLNKENGVDFLKRVTMITVAALIMAVNLKTLVRTGDLIPGGFTGLTRLIQQISLMLWNV
ncbi:MAG: YitT family protein, partial [Acetatifactor sp.]|nr:YitT family protein [Acetatifactor sp.]